MGKELELWDLWYPYAAATGVAFARGRLDPTDVLYVARRAGGVDR